MRRLLLFFLAGFFLASGFAASLPPAVRVEIDGLLARLETSGCEFQRNGTWHNGVEVKAHLRAKLSYLEERGMVASTEQFVERGATASSMTGKPYLVRCANSESVPSATWLLLQLQLLRAVPGGKRAP